MCCQVLWPRARPVAQRGVGFDYRLQMVIADKWIELPSEAVPKP